MDNRWVYDEKFLVGKEAVPRARLVVRGDQLKGTHYATEKIYVVFAHMDSVRDFCTVVATCDY